MEKAYLFEVDTIYKSGKRVTDIISGNSEKEMWQEYDKHHNKEKIETSIIIDCWIQ